MKPQQDKWDIDKDCDKRLCVECNASGKIEGEPCPFCEGQGSLPVITAFCE